MLSLHSCVVTEENCCEDHGCQSIRHLPGTKFCHVEDFDRRGHLRAGDATLNGRELAVASYLSDHLIPCLIGRDPFQTEDVWQYLYRGAYWRRGPVTMTAIAAVDMALWDIKGKALKTPVYNLLGGTEPHRSDGVRACEWARHRRDRRRSREVQRDGISRGAGADRESRDCLRLTEWRTTSCSTSRRKKACLRRMPGRRKNIYCTFPSSSRLCA